MAKPSMDDYVDVAERITTFYEKYPNGRLTRLGEPKLMEVGNKLFVQYTALAYRDPEDPKPCVGTAWEPFPGPTPFTKDSELMNAETSAWGRAIIAAGIPSKKIASREEVNARNGDRTEAPPPQRDLITPEQYKAIVAAFQASTVKLKPAEFHAWLDEQKAPAHQDIAERITMIDTDLAARCQKWLEGQREGMTV